MFSTLSRLSLDFRMCTDLTRNVRASEKEMLYTVYATFHRFGGSSYFFLGFRNRSTVIYEEGCDEQAKVAVHA